MPEPSHQTVRLSAGKHSSPTQGVCVMELSSMLAGEPFSDRPQSVCPVIAAFLRSYNDWLDDRRRQDLYAYAAAVVGSRGDAEVERRRAQLCRDFAAEQQRLKGLRRLVSRNKASAAPALDGKPEAAGTRAARAASRTRSDEAHQRALAFLDTLLEVGRETPAVEPAVADERVGEPVTLGR